MLTFEASTSDKFGWDQSFFDEIKVADKSEPSLSKTP